MKFNEFDYQRPDLDKVKNQFQALTQQLKQTDNGEVALQAVQAIQKLQFDIDTQATLSNIRHSIDTLDPFYTSENDFWDENYPIIQDWITEYYKAVLASPYLDTLKAHIPWTFFKKAENQLRIFNSDIIPLLQQENRLVSEYGKLKASAELEYKGQTYNLSSIGVFIESEDRQERQEVSEIITKWYGDRMDEFDRIYDDMVKVRHEIAQKLGFDNFIEVGYARMGRIDYDRKDVEVYRQEVLKHVVPLAQELSKRQQERLGYDHLHYYDLFYQFPMGTPKPQGTEAEIVQKGVDMYHELSPETGEFIDFMVDQDLLDLTAKKGKDTGGYCTYIPNYKAPFIFANFNGTSGDVEILTHEAGHAFQVFNSRWIQTPEAVWPTSEACEIHSMSMEFITWPWMDRFFGAATDKFKYQHLANAIFFIPYGVLVDHFQHEVYAHPEMTPEERRQTWSKLEKMYTPWKDFSSNDFYSKGGWWFKQLHVFVEPFYYIDYTLAQVCAFQFWQRTQIDQDPQAWEDYLAICKVGGSQSFTEIVKTGNLKSPFGEGNLESTIQSIGQYLQNVDEEVLKV